MLTFLIFILILSFLVLVHEFGHYITAKKSGVLVEEFGLGIPPRIIGKKIGETIYSLNAFPFGGFVRLFGEDFEDDSIEMRTNTRSFLAKKPIVRALILSAGVIMNMLLALVLYLVLFSYTGYKSLSTPIFFDYNFKFGRSELNETVINGFSESSPAEKSGLLAGEAIVSIDGQSVNNINDIREAVKAKPNEQVSVVVRDMRDFIQNSERVVTMNTAVDESGEGILGVYIGTSAIIHYENKLLAPLQHSANMFAYTFSTFGEFINIAFQSKSMEPVSAGVAGPVGIYSVVGTLLGYGGLTAVLGLLDFAALLSLSLAFMNIMPLPALDGGRLIFVFIEMTTRKPVSVKKEAQVHRWGMLILMSLLVLVTIKDIRQLIGF